MSGQSAHQQPFWIAYPRPKTRLRRPRLRPRWHAAVLLAVAVSGPLWGIGVWLAGHADLIAQLLPVLGMVAGAAGLLSGRALLRWEQLTVLDGFCLILDAAGVRWTGRRTGSIAWTNIAHLTVVGPPRNRRLWITRRGRWQPNPSRSPLTSAIMRCLRLEDLELDFPLAYLNTGETELVEAIRASSGGTFPTPEHTNR